MKISLPLLCAAASLVVMHGALAAELSNGDQRFLRKAGESGLLEIQASKLAAERAQHPEVKRYAETMIKDHTAVDKELKTLASSKGFQLPTELEGGKRRLIEKLNKMHGADFDKEYADEVAVDAHDDAVELFKDASEDAENAEVKAFAAKHLPALQKHLDMGHKLEDAVKGEHDRRDDRRVTEPGARGTAPTTGGSGTVVVPGAGSVAPK